MKTKPLIAVFIILGLIAFGGGYMLGLFSSETETADNITEEETNDALPGENESDSETVAEDGEKEDALEKEDAYADEKDTDLFIEEGLAAYYPFNEDIQDYSGEEVDATNHNAFFVDGKYGKALKFNGKNSYVYASVDINPSQMPQMTMAAWVKAEDGEGIKIVVSHDNGGYDRAMGMDKRGSGKQGWSCFAGDGKILGELPIAVDEWTFIAAVYDNKLGTVKLRVNESVISKKGKMIEKGNDFISIGARGPTTNRQGEFFNGIIDEVKIYDYALSDTELNSLYTTGVAKPVSE